MSVDKDPHQRETITKWPIRLALRNYNSIQTSNVSNSNGNMEELERQIYCQKLIFQ